MKPGDPIVINTGPRKGQTGTIKQVSADESGAFIDVGERHLILLFVGEFDVTEEAA